LVHRDVSPQNIMIARDGLVKVLDFGVAKAASETHVTRTGQLSGKAAYMSPEQATGQTVDRRTDVFAAGVVLWEAVTGQRLFRSPGAPESAALKNVLEKRVPPPTELRADVSPALERIMLRALERDPTRRFGSARDFALALEEAVPHASLSVVASGVVQISPMHFAGRPASLPVDLAAGVGRGVGGPAVAGIGAGEPWRRYLETVRPQLSATVHDVTRPIEGVAVERPSHAGTSRRSTWLYLVAAAALFGGAAWIGVGLLNDQAPPLPSTSAGFLPLHDGRPEARQLTVTTHASHGLASAPPRSEARDGNPQSSGVTVTPQPDPAVVTAVNSVSPVNPGAAPSAPSHQGQVACAAKTHQD
jgi:serine/threonine-protein kinase